MRLIKFKNGKYAIKTLGGYLDKDGDQKWHSKEYVPKYCQADYDTIMKTFNSFRIEKTIRIPKYKIKYVEKTIKIPKLNIFSKFFNWLFLGNFN